MEWRWALWHVHCMGDKGVLYPNELIQVSTSLH